MDPKDSEHLCEWFSRDQILTDEEGKPYSFTPNVRESTLPPVREEDFKEGNLTLEDDSSLPFFYHKESFTVMLTTRDLCSMFWAHKQLRQQKTSFKNPLWICLLRKFIFEYLPAQTAALWKNVASIEHGLEVVALQRLGNNLRISGEPYGKDFSKEGYTTVAADINDSIKLLSSYLARRKQWVNELPNDKRAPYLAAQRSFVVIDSIKNPFESMYLKSRYTNYYLIGTYTEDRTRHERLREKQRYPNTYIEAIDIIEQQSAFQKKWKDVESLQEKIGDLKELIAFQEMAKQLQEISKNACAGTVNADLDKLLRDYNNFAESVFQTPSEFEKLIREINEWIKHLEDLPLGSIKSSGKNRPFILQPWRDNYKTALRKCRDMQEEYEVAEVVLSTMRTVKAAKLYAEIPFILQNVEGCLRNA